MFKVGGSWYYMSWNKKDSTTSVVKYDYKAKKATAVDSFKTVWGKAGTNSFYIGTFSRLAKLGNALYFNTDKEIMKLDPKTGKVTSAGKPSVGSASIYGVRTDGAKLVYSAKNTPDAKDNLYSVKV